MEEFEDVEVITLYGENGEESDFAVVDALRLENTNYLLVINIEQDENEDEVEACILKEVEEENSEIIYELVDEDDEFEKLIQLFQENDDFDLI